MTYVSFLGQKKLIYVETRVVQIQRLARGRNWLPAAQAARPVNDPTCPNWAAPLPALLNNPFIQHDKQSTYSSNPHDFHPPCSQASKDLNAKPEQVTSECRMPDSWQKISQPQRFPNFGSHFVMNEFSDRTPEMCHRCHKKIPDQL